MELEGTIYSGNRIIGQARVVNGDASATFQARMTAAWIELCQTLVIPLPLWLPKNTRELGRFRHTQFSVEQFDEPVHFDRLVLRYREA